MLKSGDVDARTAQDYCLVVGVEEIDPEVTRESSAPYIIEDILRQWFDRSLISQEEYDNAKRALRLFEDHVRALATA